MRFRLRSRHENTEAAVQTSTSQWNTANVSGRTRGPDDVSGPDPLRPQDLAVVLERNLTFEDTETEEDNLHLRNEHCQYSTYGPLSEPGLFKISQLSTLHPWPTPSEHSIVDHCAIDTVQNAQNVNLGNIEVPSTHATDYTYCVDPRELETGPNPVLSSHSEYRASPYTIDLSGTVYGENLSC